LTHSVQRQTAREFMLHRILRIYPAYLAAVAIVWLAKYAILGSGIPPQELSWRSLTLLPFGRVGYPLWVEWSLVYEIFFYLVLGIVWVSRSNRVLLAVCGLWAVAIAVSGIVQPGWATDRLPTVFQIPVSALSLPFIGGVAAYFVLPRIGPRQRALLLPIAVVAAVATPFLIGHKEWVSLVSTVWSTALVLSAAARGETHDAPATSPWVRGGDWSYGLYLLHVPVVTIMLVVIGAAPIPLALLLPLLTAFALTIGLAYGFAESLAYRKLKALVPRSEREVRLR